MQTRIRGIFAVAAAAAVCAAGGPRLWGQQPRAEQPPAFRSGVEAVTVDVRVVDKQGQPVRGLTAGDFVVAVDGQPRHVVTAEYVDRTAQPAVASGPQPTPVSTNEGGGAGRLFAFIVDQNTLDLGGARRVGSAAAPFLSRLTFADRSALMLMPVGPNTSFTWAHDRVRDGLQRITGMGRPTSSWEYGSLADARDITNRNMLALRNIGERECGSAAAGGFGSGIGSSSPVVSAGPPSAPAGGAGGGGGGAPTGGGGTGGAGGTTSGATSSSPAPAAPRGSASSGSFGSSACTREIQMQAESTWRSAQMNSLASLHALRQYLGMLARVPGDKTVILISGGWPLDERDEISTISSVAADAAAARATIFSLYVPTASFSADRRMMSSTPLADSYLHSSPLETLSSMTGGAAYRAEVGADSAFERMARELSGYYRIGIEKDPTDVDGKNRRMKVQVTRSGATVRTREIFDVRTYEDRDWAARMGAALEAPVLATEIPLRITNYVSTDSEDSTRLKLLLSGEASRVQPGDVTLRVLISDLQGKKVAGGDVPLAHGNEEVVPFSTNIAIPPGEYIVRAAVMDSAGRVGSVDHRANVKDVPLGPVAARGPVLVRVPKSETGIPRLALDTVTQDERLALEVDLEGDKARLEETDVEFEIAASNDGPALLHTGAVISPGSRDGSVVAQGVADMRVLPPGAYVVRAKIRSAAGSIGEVRRAFAVAGVPRAIVAPGAAATVVSGRPIATSTIRMPVVAAPPFVVEQVLAPAILGVFLDHVAARPDAAAPSIRALVERARASGVAGLEVPESLTSQAPVAAFLKGLRLLGDKQFEPAAAQFRGAMGLSADFFQAMIYLGACYAANGKDKEAAGIWRTALIREGDTAVLHAMLADALLRQGRGDLAVDDLTTAHARWPEDLGLTRRYAAASLLAGQHEEGLAAVDELIEKRADDEMLLSVALLVLYEAFESGQPIQTVERDRARMLRLADTYRARGGHSVALVDTWIASVNRKIPNP